MKPVEDLIHALKQLPGIGKKTAQRLAFYLLKCPQEEADILTDAIIRARSELSPCPVCGFLDAANPCGFCSDEARDQTRICVVEDSLNVLMIEKSGAYRGLYHVLGGVIAPIRGVGPEVLNIESLMKRTKSNHLQEIILATSPTVEGMVTSRYLEKLLERESVEVTELAKGLSIGSDLEFADEVTLAMAIEGRKKLK